MSNTRKSPLSAGCGSLRRACCLALLAVALPPTTALELAGDRFVDEAGEPRLARWAFGLSAVADLAVYREAGFNVLYVDLPATPAQQPLVRQLLEEAGHQGLGVVLCLNPIEAVCGEGFLDLGDPAAIAQTEAWLADAVTTWGETPGLVAWALQSELEERLAWTSAAFGQYLLAEHGSLATINQRWDSKLAGLDRLTPEIIAELDAPRPGGVGRASLDLARWRVAAIGTLLRRWTTAITALGPEHPVIGGRMGRFRTLLAAPEELAGLQPSFLARDGWVDSALHQAGAVSVASQAGRFAAIPTIETNGDPISLRRWGRLMLGRGAAGLAFASWPELRDDPARRAAVRELLAEADALRAARFRPRPGAAVVLQPYARGVVLNGRPMYGFGSFGGDEPAALYELLRQGTRHGPLAALAPRDLTRVDLSDYGCLLLPMLVDLTPREVTALREYVRGGGVLLADLGFGCGDRGELTYLPPLLGELLGLHLVDVRPLMDVLLTGPQRQRVRLVPPGEIAFPELAPELSHPGSLVFKHRAALFPDIQPIAATPPSLAGSWLAAPAAFFQAVAPETRIIAEQAQIGGRGGVAPSTAGLAVHPFGAGMAVFCGTWMWRDWLPGEPLFDALHDGLLRQRPRLTDAGAGRLTDRGLYLARADETLWLHRVSDSSRMLQLDLPSLDGLLYARGLNSLRRPLPLGPGAPVRAGAAPLINRYLTSLAGGSLRLEAPLPLELWPATDASVEVLDYQAERIELQVFGSGVAAELDHRGRWRVPRPQATGLTLAVRDGVYRVQPGSLHRLELWRRYATPAAEPYPEAGIGRTVETLTAGPDGRLVMRHTIDEERLVLTPVAPGPAAAGAAARE